jgi:hypothetical protein
MKRVFYGMYQPLHAVRRFKEINTLISVSGNTGVTVHIYEANLKAPDRI